MHERTLATEVKFLKGVGPKAAVALNKAGIHTVGDVLYHLPRRYEDRRHLPPIGQVRPGQFATVRGRLVGVEGRPTRGGMVVIKAVIRDASGAIALTWFNQPWIRKTLEGYQGEILAYGMVKENSYSFEISNPEWETLDADDESDEFTRITPVYPLVEGLSQKLVRRAARSAVQYFVDLVEEPLPDFLRREIGLKDIRWCLRQIHSPDSEDARKEARRRLVFEEFFYLQVALALKRAATEQEIGISFPISKLLKGDDSVETVFSRKERSLEAAKKGFAGRTGVDLTADARTPGHLFAEQQMDLRVGEPLWQQVHRMLPFELTGAQRRVIEEIWRDMERPHPMNRLVQGDVGSGKTAVAACAMLAAVRCGYQAALMAPTEILAEQHANNLRRLFAPLGIEVDLLVGKLSAAQKRRAAERTEAGLTDIAVGTHALIQEEVKFSNLGFVIVDEQHRFGVLQRKALRDKGLGNPDVLVMTATPIPRTLTMTMFGDLELSVIDELPPGRKPVKTHWKMPFERDAVYDGVRKLLEGGRQAYFVCPMVSENEKMLAQAAEDLYYRLEKQVYPGLRVGLLHGQMRPKEKEEVMERFRANELDILVSTTVIEVGVDVPNASVMVVEDANRFGLSQLHQLRGRVGRGGTQSYCVLIADAKSEEARTRMEVMVRTNDGFLIAEEDLKLRGPGEMAGTKQSGNLDFKIADLVEDGKMLEVAREAALRTVAADPQLSGAPWNLVLQRVRERRSESAVITIS